MAEQPLDGGITNAGLVVRDGRHLLRPATPQAPSIHAFLRWLREAGFDGAPEPVCIDDDGRQRLGFIDGDVPVSPYPAWSQSDSALASVVDLLRRFHQAARGFDPRGLMWDDTLADPAGGPVVCHNDLELSNIVFRRGLAVAFIDFEFAAPGRPLYDLAQLARLCVPIEDDLDRDRMGWTPADHPKRLRLIADRYGLDRAGRVALLAAVEDAIDRIEAVAWAELARSGDRPGAALAATGGIEKYDRRRRWWSRHHDAFVTAMG